MFANVQARPPVRRLWVALQLGVGILFAANPAFAQTETITNAADVMALTASESAEARPVVLKAVVISESAPANRALVVADETSGIYVLTESGVLAPYRRNDLLELTGVTDPGQFAPIMKVTKARKLGTAPLPPPRPATYHQLISGALDAQWVEVAGVVQQFLPAAPGSEIRRLVLSVGGGLVHVRITDPHDPALQVDAEIRVRALCFYQFNQQRQILNPVLQVPAGIPIIVEKPAPDDPFNPPVRSSASLLVFSPQNSLGHRVHVQGVVMYAQPGSFIWIRDESAGLRLETRSADPVRPGDIIDVLGFPKFGSASPLLEDAIFRVLGKTNPPAPIKLNDPASAFGHENNLIELEAALTAVEPALEGLALSLETSNTAFRAILKLPPDARDHPDWQPGSVVRIAGICSVFYDDTRPMMGIWQPQSFQLLLRSPADVTVLKAPSWWTPKHIAFLLGIASIALFVATSVVTWLARQRLREQEQQRAMAEAEFAAILSERNRVARDIHDTLAQGLAATSVRLRLARKQANALGEPLVQHLEAAQQLVSSSLEEARNTIWNMRSQVLETGDLAGALKNILKQMADGTEVKTDFQVTGRARRLAPVIENNLLRVGQEAITNAAKHAGAKQIKVALDFGEKHFRLSVKDDGRGFDVANPPKSGGGFGMVGMRERAAELKGELNVQSVASEGTEVTLSVPLRGD